MGHWSPPVFKTVREARDVSGGFDSHTFPANGGGKRWDPTDPGVSFFPEVKASRDRNGAGRIIECCPEKPGGGYDPGGSAGSASPHRVTSLKRCETLVTGKVGFYMEHFGSQDLCVEYEPRPDHPASTQSHISNALHPYVPHVRE